uniref:Alanine racemase n=1 Tax=Desulfatirhabdium butyrativorans TaxID=340467 RepID=A0A7C4MPI8_9BACT
MTSTESIWAEIDLEAIAHNIRQLKAILTPPARFMAVVKANGYGHGSVAVASKAIEAGADMLGVARIDEAIALRQAGIAHPILVFGPPPPERIPEIAAYDLIQSVGTFAYARRISDHARHAGRSISVHIKVDTGMGRLGALPAPVRYSALGKQLGGAAIREVESICHLPGLVPEGIFTHFANADDPDLDFAHDQLLRFLDFIQALEQRGMQFPIRHAANSAGILRLPESHLDLVRAGIALYGYHPSEDTRRPDVDLKPALSWKSRIVHIKNVPKDFSISYGRTYKTPAPTRIATIAAGYADGLSRSLSSKGEVLIHGRRAPIVGRVCMDLTMIDIGHIPEAVVNDEVVLIGTQGDMQITADDLAARQQTISYEILTSIGQRVPRLYRPSDQS